MSYNEKTNFMALHALAGAMLSMGIDPVDESFEYWNCGQYRIFKLQGTAEKRIDSNTVSHKLRDFFENLNKLYPSFRMYDVSPYGCFQPDSGKLILFITIVPA